MASTGMDWRIWIGADSNLWNRDSNMDLVAEPETISVNHQNDLDDYQLKQLILKDRNGCRLCWGWHYAYKLIDFKILNGIPGKLRIRLCPCQGDVNKILENKSKQKNR